MKKADIKRYLFVIRKGYLMPVGIVVFIISLSVFLYFFMDFRTSKRNIEIRKKKAIDGYELIIRKYPKMSFKYKKLLSNLKMAIEAGNYEKILPLCDAIERSEESKGKNLVFFLVPARIVYYSHDLSSPLFTFTIIGLGGMVLSLFLIVFGFLKAMSAGRYVDRSVIMSHLKKYEMPKFPNKSILKRVPKGVVSIFVVINKIGKVEEIEVIEGPSAIMPYIVAAVRKWRFEPFLYKGKTTKVFGEIHINIK